MISQIVSSITMDTRNYETKRDFSKTRKPRGSGGKKRENSEPLFVIQKHDATNLHYDFRLEIDGTLKSWAVPKGPSTDPSVKRMAIPTEDHPIAYAEFEGTIPEGQYGGGTVMVWDRGSFRNLKKDDKDKPISLEKSYEMGTLEVFLHGEKIKGGYALIKMKSREMRGNWLLIKMDDPEADARRNPTSTQNKSVLTGRTLHQIKNDNAS